jgi:hypothetical protein
MKKRQGVTEKISVSLSRSDLVGGEGSGTPIRFTYAPEEHDVLRRRVQ